MSLTFNVPQGLSLNIKKIDGYRITSVFQPGVGYANNFYIYVVERQGPGGTLTPLPIGSGGAPQRGELHFAATNRKYVFRDIDLLAVHTRVDWTERTRFLEFQYKAEITDLPGRESHGISYEFYDTAQNQNPAGSLRNEYRYSLEPNAVDLDKYDNLISFAECQSRDVAMNVDIVRFRSTPNQKNSWLRKSLELSKRQADGSAREEDSWDIKFTQVPRSGVLAIAHSKLQALYVDHSAGHLVDYPQRSVDAIADTVGKTVADVRTHFSARIESAAMSKLQFQFSSNEVVETATLAFKQHTHLELDVK
jgi:hypothetical protein